MVVFRAAKTSRIRVNTRVYFAGGNRDRRDARTLNTNNNNNNNSGREPRRERNTNVGFAARVDGTRSVTRLASHGHDEMDAGNE